MSKKLTLAQEYQNLIYGLMQKYVLSLDGPVLINDEQLPVIHVSKEVLMDKCLLVLNEFGEAVQTDERFKNEAQ